ncbi:DUF445 domain-containing protein [Gorillibacterium massiliense]|uniref:DUF445 domain-containing protein n=1 Tax=Gorillibacterium massiliense TaxID=1280390 RepID=UPI0004B4FFAD|nr:DUF445 family protein [Gorillibacterium massiliense]
MKEFWFVIISVSVAAFVGGVTNHLAIKMLFHPRREIRWFGIKLPFTPGLIPKRKEEIGRSLGKVVVTHLVTKEGLQGMLLKPVFRGSIENRLSETINLWASREDTLEQTLLRYWPPERVEAIKQRLEGWLTEQTREKVLDIWNRGKLDELPIQALLPEWSEDRREDLARKGTEALLAQIKEELSSPRSDQMLRKITSGILEQGGGFLGSLAGMFMDENKMTARVKAAVLRQLDSPELYSLIGSFIYRKLQDLEQMPLGDAIRLATHKDPQDWIGDLVKTWLKWGEWLEDAGRMRLSDIIGSRRDWLLAQVPAVSGGLINLLANNLERMLEAIQLPVIVEDEVNKFPVEQVEEIILSLSGKEFRAITWLGVLLGGVIGLMQSFIYIWMGQY